jgi:hypothetical protein
MKRKIVNKKTIIICTIIILISFLLYYFKNRFEYNVKQIEDSNKNMVIAQLDNNDIKYKIDKQGLIKYSKKDEDAVKKIIEDVFKKHTISKPNISFSDMQDRKLFLKELKKNNIPYEEIKNNTMNNVFILWEPTDDAKVQKIIMDFNKKMGLTKRPLVISCIDMKIANKLIIALKKDKIPFSSIRKRGQEKDCIDIELGWEYDTRVNQLLGDIAQKDKKLFREEE